MVFIVEKGVAKSNPIKILDRFENKVAVESGLENGQQLIKQLYQVPITDAKQVAQLLEISPSTANRLIKELIDLKILSELTGYKRNRKFIFKEYFKIFQRELN